MRLLEIAQRAKRLPQPVELVERDRLVAVVDLGLKRVRELPPALDHAATLAVVRPGVHQMRVECSERVRKLLGAIHRAAVGIGEPRRAPHEQGAEHGVAQAPEILGEIPAVGDRVARRVVDERAELGGRQAPVGRQDLGPVVVVPHPQVEVPVAIVVRPGGRLGPEARVGAGAPIDPARGDAGRIGHVGEHAAPVVAEPMNEGDPPLVDARPQLREKRRQHGERSEHRDTDGKHAHDGQADEDDDERTHRGAEDVAADRPHRIGLPRGGSHP